MLLYFQKIIIQVEVPCMPNPLLNFDLIINPNQTLPTVCLGVSSTPDPLVYKLHLVNLNENSNSSWYTNPCRCKFYIINMRKIYLIEIMYIIHIIQLHLTNTFIPGIVEKYEFLRFFMNF